MTTLTLTTEQKARQRVSDNPELSSHWDTLIAADWPDMEEHYEWLATATIAEILDWCEAVEA